VPQNRNNRNSFIRAFTIIVNNRQFSMMDIEMGATTDSHTKPAATGNASTVETTNMDRLEIDVAPANHAGEEKKIAVCSLGVGFVMWVIWTASLMKATKRLHSFFPPAQNWTSYDVEEQRFRAFPRWYPEESHPFSCNATIRGDATAVEYHDNYFVVGKTDTDGRRYDECVHFSYEHYPLKENGYFECVGTDEFCDSARVFHEDLVAATPTRVKGMYPRSGCYTERGAVATAPVMYRNSSSVEMDVTKSSFRFAEISALCALLVQVIFSLLLLLLGNGLPNKDECSHFVGKILCWLFLGYFGARDLGDCGEYIAFSNGLAGRDGFGVVAIMAWEMFLVVIVFDWFGLVFDRVNERRIMFKFFSNRRIAWLPFLWQLLLCWAAYYLADITGDDATDLDRYRMESIYISTGPVKAAGFISCCTCLLAIFPSVASICLSFYNARTEEEADEHAWCLYFWFTVVELGLCLQMLLYQWFQRLGLWAWSLLLVWHFWVFLREVFCGND
jgi:hypothetical protein